MLEVAATVVEAVSIRLADAWPFQRRPTSAAIPGRLTFQSALRMRGLFNGECLRASPESLPGFNPPCGCVAFSTRKLDSSKRTCRRVSIRLADAWPFQRVGMRLRAPDAVVSIRLADAWPFQPRGDYRRALESLVSIRLADAWPFQLQFAASSDSSASGFQSALRMRGLFNQERA